MKIIIVSDIFGQQQYLDDFARSITHTELVTIVDPYQTERLNFINEDQAYQTFIKQCGHDNYVNIILTALSQFSRTEPITIIAFSAGSSATWRVLAQIKQTKYYIKQFIGFYPSQIRHYLHLSPKVKTQLIFPKYENHFSVNDVIETLSLQTTVACIKTDYLHGFMNPLSINFNQQVKLLYLKKLQKIILKNDFKMKNKNILH